MITRTLEDEIPTTDLMLPNMRSNYNDMFLFKFIRYFSSNITYDREEQAFLYNGNGQHGATVTCRNCDGTSRASKSYAHNHAGFCNRCWLAFRYFAKKTRCNICQFILQSQQEGIINLPEIKNVNCLDCGGAAGRYPLRLLAHCTLCPGCPSIAFHVKIQPQGEVVVFKYPL